MFRLVKFLGLASLMILSVADTPARGITFKLVGQLDSGSLAVGIPGSIAAYGDDLYVGNLFGDGMLHHVINPLTAPVKVNTFGGLNTPASNGGLPVLANPLADTSTDGYVSLHTDGTTLVAGTINGGNLDNSFGVPVGARPDIIQSYSVATDTLNWGDNSDNLLIGGPGYQGQGNFFEDYTVEGTAVDPFSGRVVAIAWGSAEQYVFDPVVPGGLLPLSPSPNVIDINGTTGWRDLSYDAASGDIFALGVNGIVRGKRAAGGEHRYTRVTNTTIAGVERIVNFNTFGFPFTQDFSTAVNVEFLPAGFAGQELVIFNKRDENDTFGEQVYVYDANAINTPVVVDFVATDGVTPFSTIDASSGIYDFSFDPINQKLYVSDFSSAQIYIFGIPGAGVTGDFDGDGDVDGRDFLAWQRNPSIGNLADWQANYGAGSLVAAHVAVPEPSTWMLLALAAMGSGCTRRRRIA